MVERKKYVPRKKDLTPTFCNNYKPKEKDEEWSDIRAKGLRIRLRTGPRGITKTWWFSARKDGQTIRIKLGEHDKRAKSPNDPKASDEDKQRLGLEQARARAAILLQQVQDGIDPRNPVVEREAEEDLTVAQFLQEYEQARSDMRSIKETVRVLRNGFLGKKNRKDEYPNSLMDTKMREITKRDCVKMIEHVKKGGPGIHRNYHANLMRFFRVAVQRDVVAESPAVDLEEPPEATKRDRYLTDSEIAQFWKGLDASRIGESTKAALKMILITGQRPNEVAQLPWSEIDGNVWRLPPERQKLTPKQLRQNPKDHIIHLSTFAMEILATCPHDGQYVFPSDRVDDQPINNDTMTRALRRYFTDMEAFTSHDLRRSCRSALTREPMKLDVIVAEKILNHRLQGMLRVYDANPYLDERRDGLERWGERLREIVGAERSSNVVPIRRR